MTVAVLFHSIVDPIVTEWPTQELQRVFPALRVRHIALLWQDIEHRIGISGWPQRVNFAERRVRNCGDDGHRAFDIGNVGRWSGLSET